MIDVLVAGAGPVGLVTAIHARLRGLDVVVVEPRAGSIDKACGEGLMPDAVDRLRLVGVDPPGWDVRGIRYLAGDRVAEARFSGSPGRGVRRTELHDSLMERAHELGVGFVPGRVDGVALGERTVEAGGVRARYLVGADGLHSPLRRTLGLDRAGDARPRFGVRQHFAARPWTDMVEVYWLSDAELYITPVADDVVGVALLGRAPLDFRAAVAAVPRLAERIRGAPAASQLRGAGPLRQRVKRRSIGRVLLVGDAAGYVDALTGEGLSIGFAEAEAAVRAIAEGEPDGYELAWRRITRSHRWLTTALLWTSARPPLRPLIVPSARVMPWAFRRIVDSLAHG